MPNVLTTKSVVLCGHPSGHLNFSGVTTKLMVNDNPVLLESDVTGAEVEGCSITDSSNAQHCQKVIGVTAGWSSKLTVGGQLVMLNTLVGTTNGYPPPGQLQVQVISVKEKLTSV